MTTQSDKPNKEKPNKYVSLSGEGTAFVHEFNEVRVKVSAEQTGGLFEIFEENCRPGFQSRTHYHSRNHQTFHIMEGEARFVLDGEACDVAAGGTVHIPPGVVHQISSEQGVRMLQIYTPGGIEAMFAEIDSLPKDKLKDPEVTKALLRKHETVMVKEQAGGQAKGTVLG
ncbi:MAG: cupin domain-containing protein [Methyloligellaceae bacterium]